MSKKKICMIAQFPPPITGLTKAVDTIYKSNLNDRFSLQKIDISNNKKIVKNIANIVKSNADVFYFTISQSKGGNFRDLIIMEIIHIMNRKCIIHLHGGYYRKLIDEDCGRIQKNLNYRAIKRIDKAIVLGKSLEYIFKGMIDDSKIEIVPNCIDDEFVIDESLFKNKIKKFCNEKIVEVLYLSNFIESKGYKDVLKLAKLAKEKKDTCFKFNFAGKFFDESEEKWFTKYIEENELHELVEYHGVVSGESKKNLLNKCHIFILLSRYEKEGQPISIIEAMSNGMIIISTIHAGIPDLVKNEENGFLFELSKLNLNTIYDTLLKIKTCKDKTTKIMIFNRNNSNSKYSESKYISNLKKIYNDLT